MTLTPAPRVSVSGSAKPADARALMDSYAVEVRRRGQLLFSAPLVWLEYGMPPKQVAADGSNLFVDVDWDLTISLVQYAPPAEDGARFYTRWPFFVDAPLELRLWVDEQWQEYHFSPGKTYAERTMEVCKQ